MPGRLIMDNILVAYKILHTFKQKQVGKKGSMALKIDMSKAYDRVEWGFFWVMMECMGFALPWIDLIIRCLTSVSYLVVLNGKICRSFSPTRGMRKDDPLSPFLFLICGEGLSTLMRGVENEGRLKGVRASRAGPLITHLLFVDDCLLFGEANDNGVRNFKAIPMSIRMVQEKLLILINLLSSLVIMFLRIKDLCFRGVLGCITIII